jgi:hypothetical protein
MSFSAVTAVLLRCSAPPLSALFSCKVRDKTAPQQKTNNGKLLVQAAGHLLLVMMASLLLQQACSNL